ncbi:hypothetical protein FGO68_gene397 [Halteria grandinella]|uniref:Uncharacterized protein n=1 Tax=Halteria grandinella TaxID=5974 RepID=A0A8J8P8C9_HALGN|nr:hypothetical protein FGO68_gene397 [Halteria grandinella]
MGSQLNKLTQITKSKAFRRTLRIAHTASQSRQPTCSMMEPRTPSSTKCSSKRGGRAPSKAGTALQSSNHSTLEHRHHCGTNNRACHLRSGRDQKMKGMTRFRGRGERARVIREINDQMQKQYIDHCIVVINSITITMCLCQMTGILF